MVKLHEFFIFFIAVLLSVKSQKSISCEQSCPGGQFETVPYPFGFNPGCKIQLNCTSNGVVLIGEFPVQQFNPDGNLLVSLPAKCGRSVNDSLAQLFCTNYAPLSNNAILMEICTNQMKNCIVPMTMLRSQLEILNCSGAGSGSSNVTCFSSDVTSMFLDYENLTRMGCQFLFSGVAVTDSPAISHDVQVVRLGWWLSGTCDCSVGADCITIVSPVDRSDGHRCKCRSGFVGDGYTGSSGCRSLKENQGRGLIRGRKLRRVILASVVGVGSVTISILIIILCLKRKTGWRKKAKYNAKVEMFLKDHEFLAPKRFSYAQVEKMTSSFKFKLGQGGFGTVYKGVLGDQNLVAVKVLSEVKGDGEDFINEVASVGRTAHVNIVSLIGFCLEDRKKALIYEFMPNGSLEGFIYTRGSLNSCQLGWEKLHQIAIGIARGLEYLHRGCSTRILHFDIKPHNILLDNDFCPKISDFGLAKLFREKESKISMSHMRGTPGYIAPELFFRNLGEISHKSDVYSYGMMILEMVGGRKNFEVGVDHSSEIYFPQWIYKKLELHEGQLGLNEIVNDEENQIARKMIIVGLWCIQTNPLSRPTIMKALEMLEGDLVSLETPPKPYFSSPPRCIGSPTMESLLHPHCSSIM